MSQIRDRYGKYIDRILLVALFGDKREFYCVEEALKFIEKVPETVPKLQTDFIRLRIKILYRDDEAIEMTFHKKSDVRRYIRLIFDIPDTE